MRKIFAVAALAALAGCQSTPAFEKDARYTRPAHVVEVHVYTDAERKEAAKTEPRSSNTSVGVGVGFGFGSGGGSFGGIMLGAPVGGGGSSRERPPLVSKGANRYTVQAVGSREKLEVNSYDKFQVGECVKLFSGHPDAYDRLFAVKPGESCDTAAQAPAKAE